MLDNIKDEIENSCSIIALEKLVNTANKIIDDYNVTNIIIPPINELLSDNKENRD